MPKQKAAKKNETSPSKKGGKKNTSGVKPFTTPEQEAALVGKNVQVEKQLEIVLSDRPIDEIVKQYIKRSEDGVQFLEIAPDMPVEEWATTLRYLGRTADSVQFAIGDMLIFGERMYGGEYSAAILATGLALGTLTNYASVCRLLPAEIRVPELSYSVQAEVAKDKLTKAKKERVLKQALEGKYTVAKVREVVKGLLGTSTPTQSTPPLTPQASGSAQNQPQTGAGGDFSLAGDAGSGSGTPTPTGGSESSSGAVPKAQRPAPSAEVVAKHEEMVDLSDKIATFLRGKDFDSLDDSRKRDWMRLLRPFAESHEHLVEQFGK